MDKKTTSWVSYLTFVGWIVAFCAGDKEGAKFYLNQSLVIWLGVLCSYVASAIVFIPLFGWLIFIAIAVLDIFLFVVWIMGLINAINQEEKDLPLIGAIKILK